MISFLYFRTRTSIGLEEEVPEKCSDDDDIASESHTPSPSLSASSTILKLKKKSDNF